MADGRRADALEENGNAKYIDAVGCRKFSSNWSLLENREIDNRGTIAEVDFFFENALNIENVTLFIHEIYIVFENLKRVRSLNY